MRIPSYRRHSSGQARVTINGKDYLLGKYGSTESKAAYDRLINEFKASAKSPSFGKPADELKIQDVLHGFLRHSQTYYQGSDEHYQYKLTARPFAQLYGSRVASKFGPAEFRALREWWMSDKTRSRQYINKQMARTLRIIRWAVGAGMMPPTVVTAVECVDSLKKGRCAVRESPVIKCVDPKLVESTILHLTPVLADMVRFHQLVGCRPGELVRITPATIDRSSDVWTIEMAEHKTAYRGKARTLYIGPKAQAVLLPYLLRDADSACFSPQESERQRLAAKHEQRKTPLNSGNRPGHKLARKPRRPPGAKFTTGSYARAIRYACERAKVDHWHPNQLRHNVATAIRKQFGIEAASTILGHSGLEVTQVYAEQDHAKAIAVAKAVG